MIMQRGVVREDAKNGPWTISPNSPFHPAKLNMTSNAYILHRYSAAILPDFDIVLDFSGIYEKENSQP